MVQDSGVEIELLSAGLAASAARWPASSCRTPMWSCSCSRVLGSRHIRRQVASIVMKDAAVKLRLPGALARFVMKAGAELKRDLVEWSPGSFLGAFGACAAGGSSALGSRLFRDEEPRVVGHHGEDLAEVSSTARAWLWFLSASAAASAGAAAAAAAVAACTLHPVLTEYAESARKNMISSATWPPP